MTDDRMTDLLFWWSLGPWDAARLQAGLDQQGGGSAVVYRRSKSCRLITRQDWELLWPFCHPQGGLTPRGAERLADLRTAQRHPSASDSDGRSPEGATRTG